MFIILSTILPILLLFLLGIALRYGQFFSEGFALQLNCLTFWVLLPCQLVHEITGAAGGFSGDMLRLTLLLLATCVLIIPIGFLVHRSFCRDSDIGVFLQGTMRGNIVYVGFPVVFFYFAGPEHILIRQTAVLSVILIIPVYNILSVLLLSLTSSHQKQPLPQRLARTVRDLATNPLILACLTGFLIKSLGIKLPLFLGRTLDGLGKASFAMALLALGASFTFSRIRKSVLRAALLSTVLRVFGCPLLGLLLILLVAPFVPFSPDLLLTALLFLATPTAVASFVMADQMGCDGDLAAAIVVLTTLLSFPALALILSLRHLLA